MGPGIIQRASHRFRTAARKNSSATNNNSNKEKRPWRSNRVGFCCVFLLLLYLNNEFYNGLETFEDTVVVVPTTTTTNARETTTTITGSSSSSSRNTNEETTTTTTIANNSSAVVSMNSTSSTTTATRTPTTETETEAATRTKNQTFRLFQVMNTYAVVAKNHNTTTQNNNNNKGIIHQPYDQWSTLLSIQRAKQNAPPNIEVTLVCAVFPSDIRILEKELEHICDRFFELERSTITEYGPTTTTDNNNHTTGGGGGTTTTTTTGSASASALPHDHPQQQDENKEPSRQEKERIIAQIFSKRELPMIQDLLNAAVSVAEEESRVVAEKDNNNNDDEGYFVMVTNSDIGLTKHFYDFLVEKLMMGRKALTINRWSIPMGDGRVSGREERKIERLQKLGKTNEIADNEEKHRRERENHPITVREPDPSEGQRLLDQIDAALPMGKKHPGYDCFVMHSSILPDIHLGELFAGFPPWGKVLRQILVEILGGSSSNSNSNSNLYARIESSPHATFHLGDQGTWSDKTTDEATLLAHRLLNEKHGEILKSCPRTMITGLKEPFTTRNTANCGIVFRENYFEKGLLPGLQESMRQDRTNQEKRAKKVTKKVAKRNGPGRSSKKMNNVT